MPPGRTYAVSLVGPNSHIISVEPDIVRLPLVGSWQDADHAGGLSGGIAASVRDARRLRKETGFIVGTYGSPCLLALV